MLETRLGQVCNSCSMSATARGGYLYCVKIERVEKKNVWKRGSVSESERERESEKDA